MKNRFFTSFNKNLEKFFLCEWISSVYHVDFEEKQIAPSDMLAAFEVMLIQNDEVSNTIKQRLTAKGIWDATDKVRQILRHPNPKEQLNLIMKKEQMTVLSKQEIVAELRDLISEKIAVIRKQLCNHLGGLK